MQISLLQTLNEHLPDVTRFWVAYSGGLDSYVLLHKLHQEMQNYPEKKLHAIHINHHLHPHADLWQQHCRNICDALGVALEIVSIEVNPASGESLEEVARNKRYEALCHFIHSKDCLLTAHHQDDQAETLLLQLFRGAGPKGLASMPYIASFSEGYHARPFLNLERKILLEYASLHELKWIVDESNENISFDRNFLRHRILPLVKERWPSAAKSMSRSAKLCGQTIQILQQTIANDLSKVILQDETLDIPQLNKFNFIRQTEIIRHWLMQKNISLPSEKKLLEILTTVINARRDANPYVKWKNGEVRRFRNGLYAFNHHHANNDLPLTWNLKTPLKLPLTSRFLSAQKKHGKGLLLPTFSNLDVKFNVRGLRCKITDGPTRTLKNLFQEWKVPPWERPHVPLLFHGDKLVAIVGYATCLPCTTENNQLGWHVEVHKPSIEGRGHKNKEPKQ